MQSGCSVDCSALCGAGCRVGVHCVELRCSVNLVCTVGSWVYLEWWCSVQSWGVLCEVGVLYEVGCSMQSRGALGTVGEALGKPPLALGQERSCRDKQDMGLGLSGDNGQERKRVQALLWMWRMSRASFNTVSSKTQGAEARHFMSAQCGVLGSRLGNGGPTTQMGVCPRPGLEGWTFRPCPASPCSPRGPQWSVGHASPGLWGGQLG